MAMFAGHKNTPPPAAAPGGSVSMSPRPDTPGVKPIQMENDRRYASSQPVDPGIIARVAGTLKNAWAVVRGQQNTTQTFFPPGDPLPAMAPDSKGRAFDYPSAVNIQIQPRNAEPLSFQDLRAIAEPTLGGWDLVRAAIETRKDQMSALNFSVMQRKVPNQPLRPKTDELCAQIEAKLQRPDGINPWETWVRMLLEEHLVIDAATIYRRRDRGGNTIALELIDGATIRPIVGYDGRRPAFGPIYQQILKGVPAADYEADELIVAPRNPRVHKLYGMSPVEQIIGWVNIGLRRQQSQLGFFTDGNIPDMLWAAPATWSIQQIAEFQAYFDTMQLDIASRRKMKLMPNGGQVQMTRSDTALTDQFDEWLARVVAYAFNLPPTPFVRQTNRTANENDYDQAKDEGLQPLMRWVKNIIDRILADWFGAPHLEMIWDDVNPANADDELAADLQLLQRGVINADDMRAKRGLDPQGLPNIVFGLGPMGFMSVGAIKKAIAQGLDLTGPTQPGMGMGGDTGFGGPGAPPLGDDPLAGLPPDLLAAIGLSPDQGDPGGDGGDGGDDGDQAQPAAAAAPPAPPSVPMHKHPEVLSAVADAERYAGSGKRKKAA